MEMVETHQSIRQQHPLLLHLVQRQLRLVHHLPLSSIHLDTDHITSLLTAMQQSQQLMQQQFLASQQELLESRKQQAEMLKQLSEFQQKQVVQQQSISEKELARTAAGTAPSFNGMANDIIVYRWCVAMERWFETAKVDKDEEKLSIAASSLKESAQTWWELEKNSTRGPSYTTWKIFSDVIKKQYLPMEPDRWVREQLEILQVGNNSNIIEYTTRFNELIQLLPGRNEIDKVMEYERGLPQQYRIESRKKNYKLLESAISAAVATYNAYRSTGNQGKLSSSIHQIEEQVATTSSSSSSSSSVSSAEGQIKDNYTAYVGPPPQQISSTQEQLDRLTAIVTQQMNRGGFNRSFYNRGRGGYSGRNRGGYSDRSPSRSRSRSPSLRSLGISKELIEARRSAKQCFKCGQEGHLVGGCRNEANTTN